MSCLYSTCNLNRHSNWLPVGLPPPTSLLQSPVLASQQNWPGMSLEGLALLGEKQHGPNVFPGLAAAIRRKGHVRYQQSLKGTKLVQGRKRGQLQPALCTQGSCQLPVTSTGPADSDIKAKVCLCLLLPKHPLPPRLPAAGLCRAACISPAGTHFLILCSNFPLLPSFSCSMRALLPCYPDIFFPPPPSSAFFLLITLAQCSSLILLRCS